MHGNFYLPYLYAQPGAENIVIFCVAILTAIIVSAEGQAFAATFLGDSRVGATDRFHFNVFRHMSLLGTLNFFIAGFGWAKEIDIDTEKFKKFPRLSLILSRLAGPLANFMMANIAASLSWILTSYNFDDQVFSTIVLINVSMAVYGLIMIPPLPGAALLWAILPNNGLSARIKTTLRTIGPYLIVGTFLLIRITGWQGLSSFFNPIVTTITAFILDF